MDYTDITTQGQLQQLCDRTADAAHISFDTEFVSEDTYQPDLCLVQIAAAGEFAVIDTRDRKLVKMIDDVGDEPWGAAMVGAINYCH